MPGKQYYLIRQDHMSARRWHWRGVDCSAWANSHAWHCFHVSWPLADSALLHRTRYQTWLQEPQNAQKPAQNICYIKVAWTSELILAMDRNMTGAHSTYQPCCQSTHLKPCISHRCLGMLNHGGSPLAVVQQGSCARRNECLPGFRAGDMRPCAPHHSCNKV